MRHHLIGVARAAGILAVALAAWLAFLQVTGNFHAVIPGEYYRSAQVDRASLSEWTREHRIRSVVNLRGANPGKDWYDDERKALGELGIRLIDYPISAGEDLTDTQVEEILAMLHSLDGPTLVHCMSGADRSGIVSAFYLADVAKAGEVAAELQLTPIYGHIPLPFLRYYAMDRTFEVSEPRFGYLNS